MTDSEDECYERVGEPIEIANEFTDVTVQKVLTKNGERLEIQSQKLGYRIFLDPLELESISWQDKSVFSELLEAPFGPDEDH